MSYASQDAEAAARICEALRAASIDVWFDQNELRGGDSWDRHIRNQIRDCALFIPVISKNTQERSEGYFRLEWRLADERTHLMGRTRAFIVPVCVDGTLEADADVPDSFLAAQWTRLPGGETSPAFCKRIAALLAGPEPAHRQRAIVNPPPARSPIKATGHWMLIAPAGLALVLAGAWWMWRTFGETPAGVGAFAGVSPVTSYEGAELSPSFSPDGDRVAFAWAPQGGDNLDIYVAQVGAQTPQRLTSSSLPEVSPRWSPDGSRIAFVRRRDAQFADIIVMPALGGMEQKLQEIRFVTDTVGRSVLAWTPDSASLVFSAQSPESDAYTYHLYLLSIATGEARPLSLAGNPNFGDMSPSVSPDGRWLAFTRFSTAPLEGELMVQRMKPGTAFVPDGEPFPITDLIRLPKAIGWSADSRTMVLLAGRNVREWSAESGQVSDVYAATTEIENATVTWKDGRARIIAAVGSTGSDIWMLPLEPTRHRPSGPPERRASSTQVDERPVLSPDGTRLAFISERTGHGELWLADAEGKNPRQVTRLEPLRIAVPNWDQQGRRLVFHARVPELKLFTVDPDAAGVPKPIKTDLELAAPSWSADGEHVYANTVGDTRIYRVSVSDGAATGPLFNGDLAHESPDGKFLLYARSGHPGIYRRSLEGDVADNAEELVVPDYQPQAGAWGGYAAVPNGLYYTSFAHGSFGAIRYHDWATRKSTDVLAEPGRITSGLTVSPDQTRLWYGAMSADAGTDLVMLEFAQPGSP